MAQDTTTKQFLDYAGLSKFWQNIDTKFASKSDAVNVNNIVLGTSDTPKKTLNINYTSIDNNTVKTITLPAATESQAGLMSAEHYSIIDQLQTNVNTMAPFAGLRIDGNDVVLNNRKGNIKLDYKVEGTGAGQKAYISLEDASYPDGEWKEISQEEYLAGIENVENVAGRYVAADDKYYEWSENAEGPVDSSNRPLFNKPISRIDVSGLIKSGFLHDADVVINPSGRNNGTYLKLTFATGELGDQTEDVYINVTDLVEIYEAGDGIDITYETGKGVDSNEVNDTATVGKISIKSATDTVIGGIKTGFTSSASDRNYAIKVDASGNAYTAVPWKETTINITSTGESNGKKYINITPTETHEGNVDAYTFNIEVGDGIKEVESQAKTLIKTVEGDGVYTTAEKTKTLDYQNTVQISLTESAKTSLAAADSAVQTIECTSGKISVSKTNSNKGETTYNIDLSTAVNSSLAAADSALQSIQIGSKTITKDSATYSVSDAKKDLVLGTASNSDVTEDATLTILKTAITTSTDTIEKPTVPSTAAVKTYIDNAVNVVSGNNSQAIATAISNLDSTIYTKSTANSLADGSVAQQVYTKIELADGKLVDVEGYSLKIKDITDFRPLTNTEIDEICFGNTAE